MTDAGRLLAGVVFAGVLVVFPYEFLRDACAAARVAPDSPPLLSAFDASSYDTLGVDLLLEDVFLLDELLEVFFDDELDVFLLLELEELEAVYGL